MVSHHVLTIIFSLSKEAIIMRTHACLDDDDEHMKPLTNFVLILICD